MKRQTFHFDLPEHLIAQFPPSERGASCLLVLQRGTFNREDRRFGDLLSMLRTGDVLVVNDTRVMPARLFGQKPTGGKVEILLERLLSSNAFIAQLRSSKTPHAGSEIIIDHAIRLRVTGRHENFFKLEVADCTANALFEQYGHIPLPPYIQRLDASNDSERYQTLFAQQPGAVAAPTAGLHFSQELLAQIKAKGVEICPVTLHVGSGTFAPLRDEIIENNRLHSERFTISGNICKRIQSAKDAGRRIIAVGTTVVRVLESQTRNGQLQSGQGETDIFIYPGFQFQMIDALVTNFHLPESSLLMLVCAFHGLEQTLAAYQHAVQQQYRFFSYGDAMFIDVPTTAT